LLVSHSVWICRRVLLLALCGISVAACSRQGKHVSHAEAVSEMITAISDYYWFHGVLPTDAGSLNPYLARISHGALKADGFSWETTPSFDTSGKRMPDRYTLHLFFPGEKTYFELADNTFQVFGRDWDIHESIIGDHVDAYPCIENGALALGKLVYEAHKKTKIWPKVTEQTFDDPAFEALRDVDGLRELTYKIVGERQRNWMSIPLPSRPTLYLSTDGPDSANSAFLKP
jgi:hypothetical protein